MYVQNETCLLSQNVHKISIGTKDAVKFAQTLRNAGKISDDVCLLLDELYLRK